MSSISSVRHQAISYCYHEHVNKSGSTAISTATECWVAFMALRLWIHRNMCQVQTPICYAFYALICSNLKVDRILCWVQTPICNTFYALTCSNLRINRILCQVQTSYCKICCDMMRSRINNFHFPAKDLIHVVYVLPTNESNSVKLHS